VTTPMLLLTTLMLVVGWPKGSDQAPAGHLVPLVQQNQLAGDLNVRSARISAAGRHVVFTSYSRLLPADANLMGDVYVFDLSTGELTLESAGMGGTGANGESSNPDISRDGRYVVFVSLAGNFAEAQIPAGMPRVFLRDRETTTTRLLTTNARGEPANGYSSNPAISADGTTIVFESAATDFVDEAAAAGKTVGVYLIRRSSGMRLRLDVSSDGDLGAGQGVSPSVSAEGRDVAFMSKADLTCCTWVFCCSWPGRRGSSAASA
jgi:hypothetical protein